MTKSTADKLLGVVIPTLGTRESYFVACLQALVSERIYLVVVGPESVQEILKRHNLHVDEFVLEDPRDPLANSINKAVARIPENIPFVSWVGDDDVIRTETMLRILEEFSTHDDVVVVFGDCDYIDESSRFLWKNQPGDRAAKWLALLPQRISQPASAIRYSAWRREGGLHPTYKLAFDYDLFLRLSRAGRFVYRNATLASYRWHPNALSVKSRKASVLEAYRVRNSNRSKLLQVSLLPIELFIVLATYFFSLWMRFRLRKL